MTKQHRIDAVIGGLLEEYNPFVIQVYVYHESRIMYGVKALLYVQEARSTRLGKSLYLQCICQSRLI